MRTSLLLSLLFSFGLVQAQDQIEWFQPTHEWYYNVYCFQNYGCGYTYYGMGETETIGDKEASVLTKIYLDEYVEPILSEEYLRFENDTAWRYSVVAEEWHMLWDMGAEPGDVWTIQEDIFYGYSYDGVEPDEIPLFKVVVDSVAFWEEIPNSPLTNRRVIFVMPVVNEFEWSEYTFGPILEGVGPVGGAHDLTGNSSATALPLQSPYFQCFLDGGMLAYGSDQLDYGSGTSPCFALGTGEPKEVDQGLIYPNPAAQTIFWNEPIDGIQLFDAVGRLVLQGNPLINAASLSVSELQTGFYAVVIERGGKSFSQKLMIHR